MSGHRVECEKVLGPLKGSYWSAIFGVYEGDRRIQEIEVRLTFRALGDLCTFLRDKGKGVEDDDPGVADAVLRTDGETRIRERLKVPHRPYPAEICIEAVDFLEPGKKEEVLQKAGLL
jgi:hypothetical protein